MMQSTQDWEGENLTPFVIWWNWHHVGFGNLLPDPLMRTGLVEVMDIRTGIRCDRQQREKLDHQRGSSNGKSSGADTR